MLTLKFTYFSSIDGYTTCTNVLCLRNLNPETISRITLHYQQCRAFDPVIGFKHTNVLHCAGFGLFSTVRRVIRD